MSNAQIKEMNKVTLWEYERINNSVLRWSGHTEGMGTNRITKKVNVRKCVISRLIGGPGKR